MEISLNGRYAVVGIGEKQKPAFCKLTVKGNSLIATVQNEFAGTAPDKVDIEYSQILAVIPNPESRSGTAFGCKLNPWVAVNKVKTWGTVNY